MRIDSYREVIFAHLKKGYPASNYALKEVIERELGSYDHDTFIEVTKVLANTGRVRVNVIEVRLNEKVALYEYLPFDNR